MDDLYLILGVKSDAKPEVIQERFRFLAQAFHPDKYSSPKQKQLAEEEFKKINYAYQILSNPRKRADYDLKRKNISSYSRTYTTDANRRAEEAARRRTQEEQRKRAEEAARQRAQEEQRKRAEDAARRRAQEEQRRKAEETASQWTQKTNNNIVTFFSFHAGCGGSSIAANLAAQVAMTGKRVAIVDTDFQFSSLQVFFGLDVNGMKQTLNDYLYGKCAITDAAIRIGHGTNLQSGVARLADKFLWLVPSSIDIGESSRILRGGYDFNVLNKGFEALRRELKLDYLLIDTLSSLNKTTLLSVGASDELVIILCPDKQDYQGTAITLDMVHGLEVPTIRLLVNQVPVKYYSQTRVEIESMFKIPVAGVLPFSEDMVELASSDIFSLRFPDHPWSQELRNATKTIFGIV
jgi:MinD-like ATPase involved in chromosome partitioning or flagellar assembly